MRRIIKITARVIVVLSMLGFVWLLFMVAWVNYAWPAFGKTLSKEEFSCLKNILDLNRAWEWRVIEVGRSRYSVRGGYWFGIFSPRQLDINLGKEDFFVPDEFKDGKPLLFSQIQFRGNPVKVCGNDVSNGKFRDKYYYLDGVISDPNNIPKEVEYKIYQGW